MISSDESIDLRDSAILRDRDTLTLSIRIFLPFFNHLIRLVSVTR